MPICQITGEEVPTLHEHHVIPREYGGLNSGTVFISPSLHDAIHRASTNPILKSTLLNNYSPEVRTKVNMLVLAIEESKAQLSSIRKRQVTITFSEKEEDAWIKLQKLSEDLNDSTTATAKKLLLTLLKS